MGWFDSRSSRFDSVRSLRWQTRRGSLDVLIAICLIAGACDNPKRKTPKAIENPVEAQGAKIPVGIGDETKISPYMLACIEDVTKNTPASIMDGLDDLGYSAFIKDICRMQGINSGADKSVCKSLAVKSMRDACHQRVAIVAERPLDCPNGVDGYGDPYCIAIAARDSGLCRAAPKHLEQRCLAVLYQQPEQCRNPNENEQDLCRRTVERYRPHIKELHRTGAVESSTVKLRRKRGMIEKMNLGTRDGAVLSFDKEACRRHIETHISSGRSTLKLHLSLDAKNNIVNQKVELIGESVLKHSGKLKIDELPAKLGDPLRITMDLDVKVVLDRLRIRGTYQTFARFIEPADPGCMILLNP